MKICPTCQRQSADDTSFCMNCGTPLPAAVEEAAAQPAPAEPVPVEVAPEPQPAPAPEPQPEVAPEPQPAAPVPVPVPVSQQPYAQQAPYGQQPYGQAPYGQSYGQAPYGQQPPAYAAPVVPDPYDHTAEFEAQDISDHKVYCMLCYLMGVPGIIIALLAGKDSPYTQFHVRTAIRFVVAETLIALVTLLLCWTVIALLVGGLAICALAIMEIVCFFQICSGKAKDPAILRSIKFLY